MRIVRKNWIIQGFLLLLLSLYYFSVNTLYENEARHIENYTSIILITGMISLLILLSFLFIELMSKQRLPSPTDGLCVQVIKKPGLPRIKVLLPADCYLEVSNLHFDRESRRLTIEGVVYKNGLPIKNAKMNFLIVKKGGD
ncbi:hypothetical protein B6U74_05330 [Candidatus Bathyarchaeota archaeon ex4484_205]|nr:MAG: hypothetical protein B6U74_05330 [Candidatus Bathyarchaeota archaeon ex4484_205]RLG67358.1 MAG: hypothetical protein DRN93_04690 [archaeon]